MAGNDDVIIEEEGVRKAQLNRFIKIASVVILGIAMVVVYNKIKSIYGICPLLTEPTMISDRSKR